MLLHIRQEIPWNIGTYYLLVALGWKEELELYWAEMFRTEGVLCCYDTSHKWEA
jgi:hypothetical protein